MPVFISPADVTPGSANWWTDIDNVNVPNGATGVILRVSNIGGGAAFLYIRKNGSSDTGVAGCGFDDAYTYLYVGVDANGIFELRISTTSFVKVELMGYFKEGEGTFFTNAPVKTLTNTTTWEDIDISGDTGGDTAIAGIFTVKGDGADIGMRKNGSSDTPIGDSLSTSTDIQGFIVGVDGSEICEGYKEIAATTFYLMGYFQSGEGVTMNTNATDLEPGSTGTYTDKTSGGNVGSIIFGGTPSDMTQIAARKNGSADDVYLDFLGTFVIEVDGSNLVEIKIEDAGCEVLELGYFSSISSIKKLSGVAQASLKKVSGVAIASVKKVSGVSNV